MNTLTDCGISPLSEDVNNCTPDTALSRDVGRPLMAFFRLFIWVLTTLVLTPMFWKLRVALGRVSIRVIAPWTLFVINENALPTTVAPIAPIKEPIATLPTPSFWVKLLVDLLAWSNPPVFALDNSAFNFTAWLSVSSISRVSFWALTLFASKPLLACILANWLFKDLLLFCVAVNWFSKTLIFLVKILVSPVNLKALFKLRDWLANERISPLICAIDFVTDPTSAPIFNKYDELVAI